MVDRWCGLSISFDLWREIQSEKETDWLIKNETLKDGL